MLCIPEDENIDINGEILGYLSTLLLEDEKFLETILSGDKKEIQNLVSEYLKKFFHEYLGRVN